MGETNLSEFNDWLKEFYLPIVREQFKTQTILLDSRIITQDSENISGKQANLAIEGISFAGVGSRAESGTLPTPQPGRYTRLTIGMKYHYASLLITGQTLAASRDNSGAFADAMTTESNTKLRAFHMDINRQLIWDGNAILALVDGTPTTTAITIDAAGGLADDVNGDKFLSEDCDIDIYSSTGTLRGTCKITAVTEGSGTSTSAIITVDALPDGVLDGDYIYRAGAKGNEMTGLYGMASTTTTLHSLAPSSFRDWVATVVTGATAGTAEPLTKYRMEKLRSDMFHRGGNAVDFVLAGPGVSLTYGDLAARGGIMVNRVKVGTTDWEGADWGGRAIVEDSFMPKQRMFYLARRVLTLYQMNEPSWLSNTSGSILDRVYGTDTYRADYGWYSLLGCSMRRGIGMLSDITELS